MIDLSICYLFVILSFPFSASVNLLSRFMCTCEVTRDLEVTAWVSTPPSSPHNCPVRSVFIICLYSLPIAFLLLAAFVATWESSFLPINQKGQSIGFLHDLHLMSASSVSSNLVPNLLFSSSHFICSSISCFFWKNCFLLFEARCVDRSVRWIYNSI